MVLLSTWTDYIVRGLVDGFIKKIIISKLMFLCYYFFSKVRNIDFAMNMKGRFLIRFERELKVYRNVPKAYKDTVNTHKYVNVI